MEVVLFIVGMILLMLYLLGAFDLFMYSVLGLNTQELFNKDMYKNIIPNKEINKFFKTNKNFTQKVQKGQEHIKNKKIVICALARNIEKTIPKAIEKALLFGKGFKEHKLVIFENDSSDGTRSKIKEHYGNNDNVILMNCCDLGSCDCKLNINHPKGNGAFRPSRIEKMARFRNLYLDYIKKNFRDYDYMLVYDIDMRGGIYLDGYHSIYGNDNWDVITARGLKVFPGLYGKYNVIFDILAFVPIDEDPRYVSTNDLVEHYRKQQLFKKNNIGDDLIEVNSAFNGAAVYKIKDILDIQYDSNTRCEHIDFHIQLLDKGKKIYIDPSFIIQAGLDNETTYPIKNFINEFR